MNNNTTRQRKINKHIIQGNINKTIWKLALPMTAGAVLFNLFSLVDLFFVGRLGHIAVAALSVSGILLSIILMFAIGIAIGTTAMVARFIGIQDYDSADSVVFHTILISIACWVIMALIGIFACEGLLRLFGVSAEVVIAAAEYLRINFIWSIFIFLFVGLNQALRGAGDVIVPLKVIIIANIINIVLDPLFIFGWGIFPRMEVAGSAVATVISRAAATFMLLFYMLMGRSALHLHRRIYKLNFVLIRRMIRIGFYASLQVFLREVSLLFLLRLVSSFGVITLAAFGIGSRLRMMALFPGIGMANTAAILIGQNMGAKQPRRATQVGWRVSQLYLLYMIPLAATFFIFAPQLIRIFNSHPDIVRLGATFLRCLAVTFPFLAFSLILSRGISGSGDSFAPAMITGATQLAFCIPAAYFMVLFLRLGMNGIWIAVVTSDILQGILFIYYFYTGAWQKYYYRHQTDLTAYPLPETDK
ncbi:MAG: MATE family efflux transporter [Candidatus Omnitrophota bacterium]